MPENEFEKNIQGRLDFLSLEPSPAVWQAVELRIRKDRRKRRWFIWLPLAAALGTGMWFWMGSGPHKNEMLNASAGKASQPSTSTSTATAPQADQKAEQTISKDAQQEPAIAEKNTSSTKPQLANGDNANSIVVAHHKNDKYTRQLNKKSNSQPPVALKNDGVVSEKQQQPVAEATGEKVDETLASGNVAVDEATSQQPTVTDTASIAKADQAKVQVKTEKTADNAAAQKLRKPKNWHWGIVAGIGISTQSNSIFSASHARANDLYTSQNYQGAPLPTQNTTAVKSGLAFSFGGFVERRLNKSISVEMGINYAQYATSVTVGQKVDSAIAIFFNASSFLPTNSYYRATGSEEKTHQNIYRFLELPVKANIRLNPRGKTPFRWELGLTPAFLLSTNALNYDAGQNVFYRHDDLYNKFQLGLNTGLSMMLFSKSKWPFWIGPEYRGFLMNLTSQVNSKGNHLNYGGIRLAFPLGAW